MIHLIMRFTLVIAFRCALHRCENQDIRCLRLFWFWLCFVLVVVVGQVPRVLSAIFPWSKPTSAAMAKGRCESGGGNRTPNVGLVTINKSAWGAGSTVVSAPVQANLVHWNGLKLFLCTFSLVAFTSEKTEFRLVGCFLREGTTLGRWSYFCADDASSDDERQRNKQG